jgi:hypothetical protein
LGKIDTSANATGWQWCRGGIEPETEAVVEKLIRMLGISGKGI